MGICFEVKPNIYKKSFQEVHDIELGFKNENWEIVEVCAKLYNGSENCKHKVYKFNLIVNVNVYILSQLKYMTFISWIIRNLASY